MAGKNYAICRTPVGELYIVCENEKIIAVYLDRKTFLQENNHAQLVRNENHPLLKEAVRQLNEYFAGTRKEFELPVRLQGTPFQLSVWEELQKIPYGETRSYQEIAVAVGNKNAVRAIGQANKANPLPIIIPCHRVIGKNKKLTGYAGKKVDVKAKLLEIEGAVYCEG